MTSTNRCNVGTEGKSDEKQILVFHRRVGGLHGADGACRTLAARQAASFYAEAAKPYKGTIIRVLDEITPLQETFSKIVPEFEKETGIKVEWELLNHFEVINKGQADMLSGRGYYDAVMMHGFQLGPMLSANVILPIDELVANPNLNDPGLDPSRLHPESVQDRRLPEGKQYGFINWNYNQVYWARADLLNNPEEIAAFKAKFGYDLAPAKTIEQMRDIAEFFTRKKGEKLAGAPRQRFLRHRARRHQGRLDLLVCCGTTSSRIMAATSSMPTASRFSTRPQTSRH